MELKYISTVPRSYKIYREDNSAVNAALHSDICKRFNKGVLTLIIEKGIKFKMPYKLGFIRIKPFKLRKFDEDGELIKANIRVDYGETIKYYQKKWHTGWKETQALMKEKRLSGEKIEYLYHFNNHTKQYNHRWLWEKPYPLLNKSFFLFKTVKSSRLALSRYVQANANNLNYEE